MPTLRTIRIIANRNDHTFETVNVSTVDSPQFEKCLQSAVATPDIQTVQASDAPNPKFKTIFVAGYTGPA